MKSAQVLNKVQDVQELGALHANIKRAFNERFFDEQLNLNQGIETQTTYLLGLAYGLFPEDKRDIAIDKLLALLEEAESNLRTGFLGTPLLTQVFQDVGRSDVIYDLLFKEINIEPQFGEQLNQASGSYGTPQGDVSVSWETKDQQLEMQVIVPKNTSANFVLPRIDVTKISVNGESLSSEELLDLAPGEYIIEGNFKVIL